MNYNNIYYKILLLFIVNKTFIVFNFKDYTCFLLNNILF